MILKVKHNIEVAHRLSLLPGKCENIHGHSMNVILELTGFVDKNGIMAGVEFGALKKRFRGHLDEVYDHHLLLNESDPFAPDIITANGAFCPLPGLRTCQGDPTTENIAQWIATEMIQTYGTLVSAVEVWETAVNCARWER
jgi:6-pyruvoyltetrahydropterin/6-carboxytetrahydropterin synthase